LQRAIGRDSGGFVVANINILLFLWSRVFSAVI